MPYRTAEDITGSLAAAAEAVQDYLGAHQDPGEDAPASERATRRTIAGAMAVDRISAAQIADAAGVRQLLVCHLIDDDRARREALAAARRDADRYAGEVLEQVRAEALRWWDRGRAHATKTVIAQTLGISRDTLDSWIAADRDG